MALDVIGAGFGRTGTLSLKQALETLGFDACYHMAEVAGHPDHPALWSAAQRGEPVDWDALFEGYRAAVDWPSCNFWCQQLAHDPHAKVVLSTRDPESWYRSVRDTIYQATLDQLESDDPQRRVFAKWAFEIVWDPVFGGRLEDEAHCIAVLRAHEEAVKAEVPAEQLLVFEARQGWEPLCRFLERPIPDEPYPRTNTSAEFAERWRR